MRTEQPIKVVAFDCDGVLFDSKEANIHFYNTILAKFGRSPVRPDQEEFVHMHSAQESLEFLFGNGPTLRNAWEHCQNMDFSQFNGYLRVEPGLIRLLEALKPHYSIALATNRTVSTRGVLAAFELDHYFDFIVTAADVRHPKPHPECMERISAAFTAAPQEILYIGDSRVDQDFALATRVYFVAYKNRKLNAQLHISHFDELHPLLLAENG